MGCLRCAVCIANVDSGSNDNVKSSTLQKLLAQGHFQECE